VAGSWFHPVTLTSSTINIDRDYVAELLLSVDLSFHIPNKTKL